MFEYNNDAVMWDSPTQQCESEHHGGASGIAAFTMPAMRAAWGWYLFRCQPFMNMPAASKRKTPASLEAVDATKFNQLFWSRTWNQNPQDRLWMGFSGYEIPIISIQRRFIPVVATLFPWFFPSEYIFTFCRIFFPEIPPGQYSQWHPSHDNYNQLHARADWLHIIIFA